MAKKIYFSIAFLLFFALNVKAQNHSDYTWVPLKSLFVKKGVYNTNIPIYAVGLKKVEESGFRSNMHFSEKPNMVQEGHYVVDVSKLIIEMDSKENITEFDQLKDIGDGWKGMKFKKPLYLLYGDKYVSQNMIVCINKNDYAKITGSNNDNSFSHLNTNLENIASSDDSKTSSRFILEKSHKDIPNQSKSEFTTPEAAGYTLLDTKTIEGFKCDYYLEGVRTFRFGNGDFMTFPDGKDDGFDNRRPSRNHSSLGDWQMTTNKGYVVKNQNGIVKIDFPSGVSVSNRYGYDHSWYPYNEIPPVSVKNAFYDLLYLPDQTTPLTFYKVVFNTKRSNRLNWIYKYFETEGYLNDDRLYKLTEDGVAYPYKQKVNDCFISAIASDTITKANLVIQDEKDPSLELEYSNGDNLNCVYGHGDFLIKSGTIHRNGGVLTIKEVNGRVVKILTFSNGDKYAGEFKYDTPFEDIFKLKDLSQPELQYWNGTLIKADGKKIVFEKGKTEQQRLAESQAQNAKTMAQYNQLCKQFGQKYVDAALAQTPIVGMPEKLLQAAFKLRLIESGTNYKMYRINGLGWENFGRTLSDNVLLYTVWVRNGRVTDVRYWGN